VLCHTRIIDNPFVIRLPEKQGANGIATEYRSFGYETLAGIATSSRRIVVLVNRNSASASEILAGALQDYGVAKIVGEQSFGKGSVQTIVDIGQLGTLKITIARWYTPKGNNIGYTGITPDITVDFKNPKYASSTDPFMDAAVETILDDSLWK
jgi:C-terminal peptidase prc